MSNPPGPRANFSLRNVNTNKPQYSHTGSRQSVAASDDYYSLSDRGNSSSPDSRVTVMRFQTPDSHLSAPSPVSRTRQGSPIAESSRQEQRALQDPRPGTSSTVRFGEETVSRLSPSSEETPRPVLRDYAGTAATPGLDDSPYVRFAIDQLTRDEVARQGRHGSVSSRDDYSMDRLVWNEDLGYFTRTRTPIRHDYTPPMPHQQQATPSPQALPQRAASVDPESFVAVDSPEQSLLYPALDYLPVVLRPWALAPVILCSLLMAGGVLFCNIWSQRNHGLWGYKEQGDSRYFVMEFLPQILAMPIMIWTFVVQAAVYRTAPFAIMAAERPLGRVVQELPILSRNFIIPDFTHFRHGEPMLGISLFTIWLSNFFSIPLLSCLFQAKYYSVDGQDLWKWTSVQAVGWALVGIYGVLAIGLTLLLARFTRNWTGLMWDPTSLADLVSIIQRSNILHDFEHSETVPLVRETLDPRVLRLGYWRLSGKADTFYGIGEVDAPIRTPSLHQTEKSRNNQQHSLARVCFDIEHQGRFGSDVFDHQLYSPFARYRWTPWYLRNASVIVWITIVFVLFLALVLVSFIHNAIEDGFVPRLPTLPSISAFSSSNFLYSFIPAFIGNVLFLVWQPIDVSFRALQPFVELSSPHGATAEKSILLAYPSSLPIQVTLQALLNGHYKVAWISLTSVIFGAIPILSGGVFMSLFFPSHNDIRISAFMPAFYALIVFCGVYAASFLAIFPRRYRYLPHDINTLADLMSFLYQSPLLTDKLLREPRSKTDLVTRLIVTPPSERELPLYGFGIYVGRDGKEHLGIDRFSRPGRSDMLITTGTMK
ncbi:hypothetical protein N7510_000679 [Penicillium lagena]|uniref:uncharacterized protein n=1 Tax=Penicillium lagena TaxID=94218 RepID=UPI002541DE31|nr:uncharacterized protein N7510_000679 [Penicillium lagena]KAJ5624370.1 hypothetical protein N7510_000679 [Penicillium lagena]